MTAQDQWERGKQLFANALNLPRQEQGPYLLSACADSPDLLATVEELLRNHYAARGLWEDRADEFVLEPTFRNGQLIARRYRAIRLIARGGMGEVYEAFDELLRVRIALKTIRGDFMPDANAFQRLRREVKVAREVCHPSVCRVFDFFEHEDGIVSSTGEPRLIPCLTMNLLEGKDLQNLLDERRPLSCDEALPLIRQICEALQLIHKHGIAHRDLKPSNVMLIDGDEAGTRVVLTDFGLARPLESMTMSTGMLSDTGGTPYFLAPEIWESGKPGVAADIYSLGLVIDEMVTPSRAFTASSLAGLCRQKLTESPIPPLDRAPDLPHHWSRAILRCLDRNPEARFREASEVVHALENPDLAGTKDEQRLDPQPESARPPLSGGKQSGMSRRRAVLLACLFLTVALGGLLYWWIVSRPFSPGILLSEVENLSGDGSLDYFCKGTSVELARQLALVRGLRIYRASKSFTPAQLPDIPYELRGALRRQEAEVRLFMELSDRRTGEILWSDAVQRPLENAIELPAITGQGVVRALEVNLLVGSSEAGPWRSALAWILPTVRGAWKAEASTRPGKPTTQPAAIDAYYQGRALWEKRTVPDSLSALDWFHKATTIDPSFALAYAAMADIQAVLMDWNYAPHAQLIAAASQYAEKAIALEPDLAEAQVSLAAVRQWQYRTAEAEQAYLRALTLQPRSHQAKRWYSGFLMQHARFPEALDQAEQAMRIDPFDRSHSSAYGLTLFYSGRAQEAALHLERLLRQSDYPYARPVLGQTYAYLAGNPANGSRETYFREACKVAEQLSKDEAQQGPAGSARPFAKFSDLVFALANTYHGDVVQALPYLRRLEGGVAAGQLSPETVARVYSAMGRQDDALAMLERAAQYQDRGLMNIAVSPFYRSLRNHPRFRQLLARMDLL